MKKVLTLALFALSVNLLFAEVKYTYVDEIVAGFPLDIDIDGDGDNDFSFGRNAAFDLVVIGLKNTSYFVADANNIPKAYDAGSPLGSYQWASDTGLLAANVGSAGFFKNEYKYLMVKFNNTSGQTFYAWFYLSVNNSNILTVISYAYQDVAGQTIEAGDFTGINDLSATPHLLAALVNNDIVFTDTRSFNKAVVFGIDGRKLLEIDHPEQSRRYPLDVYNQMVVVAVYNGNRFVASAKYYNR